MRPRFTIVSAVYDVEPYLPDYIASVEELHVGPGELEVIAVDDGSTDGSLDLLRAWAAKSRHAIHVFTQPNAGQGPARNRGLEHATGEWVTFTDPDDMLGRDYFRVAARFAGAHPDVEVMAGRPMLLEEGRGRAADTHPRRRQYERGNRLVDLAEEPNVFPGSTAVSLYRLDRIRELGLRFDSRVRPNFEDGHLAVRYLLGVERPRVGILRDAVYVYRKRASGTSTLQRSLRDPGRYTAVLEHGYLDVIERARAQLGGVPEWLQHVLIYELSWYLSEDEKIASNAWLAPEIAPRFHELLARIIAQLEPAVIARHDVRRISSVWLDLLSHGGRPGAWHASYAVQTREDRAMRLVQVSYRFVGTAPAEHFAARGSPIEPAFAKTMAHRWYGRDLLSERILWFPAEAEVEISLEGTHVPIRPEWPRVGSRRTRTWAARLRPYLEDPIARGSRVLGRRAKRVLRRARNAAIRFVARQAPYRKRFRDAWVVMDRIHDADDNGERLFEYITTQRPDINAWFVVERGTPDWARLAAKSRRVIDHGSFTWKLLMARCRWLISSHVDKPVVKPPQIAGLRRGDPWRFAFLQHGVIKDDLSRWLNAKELELFVVSTEPELASVAGDGTAYRFTTKETQLTGLPRFDRLLEKGRAVPPDERTLVIVSPTWRNWLTVPLASGTQRREVDAGFWDSEYIRSWLGVLRSPTIAAALRARGWRLGFMPHPNLQSALAQLDLPPHVERLAFAGEDVQAFYGRCALLVTDYSSVAFNAAYLDRPVVYFQFDRAAMLGGAHVGREGYFDYARDGFGPVVGDLAAAERAIVAAIEHGARPTATYQQRIDATFPLRDGTASAQVVAAIEASSRPWQPPSEQPRAGT